MFSSTIGKGDWNTRPVAGNAIIEITRLKADDLIRDAVVRVRIDRRKYAGLVGTVARRTEVAAPGTRKALWLSEVAHDASAYRAYGDEQESHAESS